MPQPSQSYAVYFLPPKGKLLREAPKTLQQADAAISLMQQLHPEVRSWKVALPSADAPQESYR